MLPVSLYASSIASDRSCQTVYPIAKVVRAMNPSAAHNRPRNLYACNRRNGIDGKARHGENDLARMTLPCRA